MFTRIASIALVSALASASAHAGYISYLDLPRHETSTTLTVDGIEVNVQAVNGKFKVRRKGYKAGAGVSKGGIKRLIDGSEAIVFTFSEPVMIDMLTINRLFSAGHRKDRPNEKALVMTDAGDYMLEAMSKGEAMWHAPDGSEDMMVAWGPLGGRRMIHGHDGAGGIFAEPVTRIELCSGFPGPRYRYSDFSFVGMEFVPAPVVEPGSTTVQVPAPATLPALAAALGALASRRRRPPAR